MDAELEQIEQAVQATAQQIPTQITTREEYDYANEILVAIATEKKKWAPRLDLFVKSAKRNYDEARATRDGMLAPLVKGDQQLRQMARDFLLAEKKQKAEEQRRELQKHEKRVERAEAAGKDVTEVAPPRLVQTPPKTSHVAGGGAVTEKLIPKLNIFDESLIPDAYMIKTPNKKLIQATLETKTPVPGCALEWVPVLAVRT